MPRTARLDVKGEPAVYHVMSRTAEFTQSMLFSPLPG